MTRRFLPLLLWFAIAGCQRASRYPAAEVANVPKEKAEAKAIWGWMFPAVPPRDLPIRFVADDSPEWPRLTEFWNNSPAREMGTRTIHLGQPSFFAAGVIVAADSLEAVVVKVPRGLADPTASIPAANPPTYGKWRLGKRIFFDRVLMAGADVFACADCHQPNHGFTSRKKIALEVRRDAPSLINAVYNRSQFWDGRVKDLEETLVQSVDDELQKSRMQILEKHRWGGVARRLDNDTTYRSQFKEVFGVPRVTQDDVAKALATYIRTILSGDSLFDRAATGPGLWPTSAQYAKALDDDALKRFVQTDPSLGKLSREHIADLVGLGQSLFSGKGGCVQCHPPGVFTNGSYHNVTISDSGRSQAVSGGETGRFAVLEIGVKDPAMRGAYRVPTLRNLSSTAPYFHDGSRDSIEMAVDFFASRLDPEHPLLSPKLKALAVHHAPAAILTDDEVLAVSLFLRALDGQPVDRTITTK